MNTNQSLEDELVIIIHSLFRAIKETTHVVAHTHALSVIQMHALWEIATHNPTMSELAKALYVKLPTITVLVEKLVEMGYVERIPQKDDRRVVALYITKKGTAVMKTAMDAKMEKFKTMLSVLSEHDKQEFYRILQTLYTHL